MSGGRIGTMKEIQAPYFAAFDRLDRLTRARFVPAGYERNYRRGGLFVCVCPWHWRAYSHYQFWEVLAAAHLAKLGGAASTVLVTNDEWTDWCWDGFAASFDQIVKGEPDETADAVATILGKRTARGRDVERPKPGRAFFGTRRKSATTMALKQALDSGLRAAGERADRPGSARPYFSGLRAISFHHAVSNGWLVHVKGFRNPDPVHELKILAGKAFAVGPERAAKILYVVDGRLTEKNVAIVTKAGANITTPDRYREAVAVLAR